MNAPVGSDPKALAALADSLLSKGKLQEAEETIQAALALTQGSYKHAWYYPHYFILARIWAAQHRDQDALEAFQYAVKLSPTSALSHAALGDYLLKQGRLTEAEVELRRAILLDPKVSRYHASLGSLLVKQCFYDDAQASIRRAIRLDRKAPRPRLVFAELLAARGDHRGEKRLLAKAFSRAARSPEVLWTLCSLFEKRGETHEAIACMKKLIELDPSNAGAHSRMSSLYSKTGEVGG